MASDDLVGMENIAYQYEEKPQEDLIAGRGVIPGEQIEEEQEDNLISGRGVVP